MFGEPLSGRRRRTGRREEELVSHELKRQQTSGVCVRACAYGYSSVVDMLSVVLH